MEVESLLDDHPSAKHHLAQVEIGRTNGFSTPPLHQGILPRICLSSLCLPCCWPLQDPLEPYLTNDPGGRGWPRHPFGFCLGLRPSTGFGFWRHCFYLRWNCLLLHSFPLSLCLTPLLFFVLRCPAWEILYLSPIVSSLLLAVILSLLGGG